MKIRNKMARTKWKLSINYMASVVMAGAPPFMVCNIAHLEMEVNGTVALPGRHTGAGAKRNCTVVTWESCERNPIRCAQHHIESVALLRSIPWTCTTIGHAHWSGPHANRLQLVTQRAFYNYCSRWPDGFFPFVCAPCTPEHAIVLCYS